MRVGRNKPDGVTSYHDPYRTHFYFQFQLIWDLRLKQNEGTSNTLMSPEM